MAITDPAAIKYCNEHLRPSADVLARCYYRTIELNDAWEALPGTDDDKFNLLTDQIVMVATLFDRTFMSLFKADRQWDAGSIASVVPNDPAEELWDNEDGTGQDADRPPLNGQDIHRCKKRMEEWANWLARGTTGDHHFEDNTGATLAITYDFLDQYSRVAIDGAKTPTASWGLRVAVTRAENLRTEYEVTNTGFLGHILSAAVNPFPSEEV